MAWDYGLFTGGLGAHYGLERLGATVIPASGGNSERQVMLIQDLGVTVWMGAPSLCLDMLDAAERLGVDLRQTRLRLGIFGAEPWSEGVRAKIEQRTGIRAYDLYGLAEVIGPGVSSECEAHCGLHIFEDHFYPEIVDPETLQPLPGEARGELVLTTLTKQGMPLIRFRTRDVTRLYRAPCRCGRTTCRMARVFGRTDEVLVVRGVSVLPAQIETLLLGVEGTRPHCQIVVGRQSGGEDMEVRVEVAARVFGGAPTERLALERRVRDRLENALGLRVRVSLLEPGALEHATPRPARVIDRRGEMR